MPFKASDSPRPEIKRIEEIEGALAFEVEVEEVSYRDTRLASTLAILSQQGEVLLECRGL